MFRVDVDHAIAFAPSLSILHQETGELSPFVLSAEQRIIVEAMAQHRRIIVLKGRQTYTSTGCVYYALMFAAANPGVKVAIVADIKEKAEGLLAKATAWAREAGFPAGVANTQRLALWNGAELHAVTANTADVGTAEVKAGRSFTYALVVLSEFAFYNRDAALLASITRSLVKGGSIVLESTATPAENAFRSIWEKGRGWHKIFLPFELHETYQDDPDSITDAQWVEMQERWGFTSRPHAAYWWRMMTVDLNGDVHRALREAPVLPEHAFSFAEGRWIFVLHEAAPKRVEGHWSYYDEPDASGVVLGIDTASGVSADASAIGVVSYGTGRLVATYKCNTVGVPDFIRVCREAVERWKPAATVVETNGIGAATHAGLAGLGAHLIGHWSEDAEKPIRMDLVRQAIESGQIAAGPELAHEAKHSVVLKPKRAGKGPVWDGPDDLLNALGFALVYRRDVPYVPPPKRVNPYTHVADFEPTRKRMRA